MDAPCRAGPAPSPSRTLCHTRLPPAGVWWSRRATDWPGLLRPIPFPVASPSGTGGRWLHPDTWGRCMERTHDSVGKRQRGHGLRQSLVL
jgi:hypothetical protein